MPRSAEGDRADMLAMLTLEAIRDAVCPGNERNKWGALGWSRALSGRLSAAKFIHKIRLRRSTGTL